MSRRHDRSQWMTMDKALQLMCSRDPLACWDWPGARDHRGRGLVVHEGKQRKAHRVAYERLVGPILPGLEPDHLCRNLSCFNPRHLEPVTHAENMRRGESIQTKNALKTHCLHGHPFDTENSYVYQRRSTNGRTYEMRVCRQCKLDDSRRRRRNARVAKH